MTKAQIDLAHKTVGDIGHCVCAMEQYGNGRIASVLRIAADLLQKMVEEYEAAEQPPPEPGPWVGTGRAGNGSDM